MKKKSAGTSLRRALRDESSLLPKVVDGIGAVEAGHRNYFDEPVRRSFEDSLALDEALRAGNEGEHRWDYLLGHGPSGQVIAVEPHSAKQDQVSTIIRKRAAAREQLRPHLESNARVARWLWVASGAVQFADTDKARRRLDQHGIEFVGRKVLERHLPTATETPTRTSQRPGRSRA